MDAAALYKFAETRNKAVLCFAHVINWMAQTKGSTASCTTPPWCRSPARAIGSKTSAAPASWRGCPLSARHQNSMIALGVVSSMWRPSKVEQPRTQCRAHYDSGTGRVGDGDQLAIAIDTAAPFLPITQHSDR